MDPDAEASPVYSENDNDYLSIDDGIDDGLSTAASDSVAVSVLSPPATGFTPETPSAHLHINQIAR